ncbi:hypothetical protein JX580_05185 [Thiomicrospira microaerophila]|uniref:hypothetical protein n=1 Tax=Thiomicrospira microaerophila TaxID=406020 RepID=UPI00200F1034|nr:hypothetical protein [Thiomicrospira microaerophila]UQB43271.1 hypothetical protein JX580_05185 [Thiomicrospira microaerophila]
MLSLPPSVKALGAYRREDLADLIADIKPNIGVVLSIWPETWCHTLTEYLAHGVSVVASPQGAVGVRLAESGAVLDWQQGVGKQQTTEWMAKQYWQMYEQAWQPLRVLFRIN